MTISRKIGDQRNQGLIIDYDDVPPPRPPRGRRAVLAGVGIAIVAAGLWLALSSIGAFSSSPGQAPRAPTPKDSLPTESLPPAPSPSSSAASPQPQSPQPPEPSAAARVRTPANAALLSLDAAPWGTVYVDGRSVGATPVVELPLAAGAHHVRVEREGYAPYERVIDAAPGQRIRIAGITLQEQ